MSFKVGHPKIKSYQETYISDQFTVFQLRKLFPNPTFDVSIIYISYIFPLTLIQSVVVLPNFLIMGYHLTCIHPQNNFLNLYGLVTKFNVYLFFRFFFFLIRWVLLSNTNISITFFITLLLHYQFCIKIRVFHYQKYFL